MFRRSAVSPFRGLAWLAILSTLSCADDRADETDEGEPREADDESAPVIVFESRVLRSVDGVQTPISVAGEVTQQILEQVARPWSYRDEAFVYQEEAWEHARSEGSVEVGYRIIQMVREPFEPPAAAESIRVDSELVAQVELSEPLEQLPVHMRLRGFPEWNIPPHPNTMLLAEVDRQAAADRRSAALTERQALADEMAAELVASIEAAGGEVVAVRGTSGWVWARLPAAVVLDFAGRDDIDELHWPDRPMVAGGWRQGDGRWSTRMNVDTYHSSGFDGSIANADRHSWGRLLASAIEAKPDGGEAGFEDEACAFYDGSNCQGTSRIVARYQCDDGGANPCGFVSNFAESMESSHGTAVAAVLVGDYEDGQGCTKELGDDSWDSGCHTSDWNAAATGMAPEAWLVYFAAEGTDWPGSNEERVSDALDKSYILNHADVINMSLGLGSGCSIDPGGSVHDEVENAFDDGALVVASSGNVFGPSSQCNIWHPAGLVKSLAINAFDAYPQGCQDTYHSWCLLDQEFSAMGGINANVTGTTRSGAITGNDLVGPNNVVRWTTADGSLGDVAENIEVRGTSYASPTVAGTALLVKHRMLHFGHAWINSPGRLKTIMLAMGDRHYSTNPTSTSTATTRGSTGGDDLYGFGRLTLRKFGTAETPTSWSMITWNTKTATYTGFPLGGPLPSGTNLAKCVLQQHEDLSGSTYRIADFDLRMRVLQPVNGACSSSGNVVATRFDNSWDAKSVVAANDSVALDLAGKCIEVQVIPDAADVVTSTNTFCYYSGLEDDE